MISRHLSKILPAVLLLGLFPALAQAQMFLGEREALKQESRLELSHSTSDEKTETDAGVGLEVLTEKSRSNMAAISFWGGYVGAGVTGNLSEDESTSGTYRVAEKTASQGGYLALRLPLFSKYDELILVGSHETYLKQYGLDIFSTSTQVRRDIDFHTKYHSGVIYRFLFLSLGYSGGREKLDMYISQNGVELFREEYDFFSHTRMASISLAAGGNSTIMLSWMRKDSPKAVGKELDLLTFSRDIKYVQLDLGPLGLHYEHHLESHQLGSISETTYELRRYGLGVDLGDGFRFGISHEQRDKKEESTLPIFDSYSKKSTRVQFEWYY